MLRQVHRRRHAKMLSSLRRRLAQARVSAQVQARADAEAQSQAQAQALGGFANPFVFGGEGDSGSQAIEISSGSDSSSPSASPAMLDSHSPLFNLNDTSSEGEEKMSEEEVEDR